MPIQKLGDATNSLKPEDGISQWFVGCCGLISYREGNYEEAIVKPYEKEPAYDMR